MGLLDDAIREHLELKRRRGADPGEVAREQREALDPIGGSSAAEDGLLAAASADKPVVSGAPLVDPPGEASIETTEPPDVAPAEPGKAVVEPELAGSPIAGETAELDMSQVLGEDTEHAPAQVDAPEQAAEGDSLEWEMPMPADTAARETPAEGPDEDVLEETPDFLRDTPEQERLWFEQRPPRDFDFDK